MTAAGVWLALLGRSMEAPLRSAHPCSWSAAAARKVSAATSITCIRKGVSLSESWPQVHPLDGFLHQCRLAAVQKVFAAIGITYTPKILCIFCCHTPCGKTS